MRSRPSKLAVIAHAEREDRLRDEPVLESAGDLEGRAWLSSRQSQQGRAPSGRLRPLPFRVLG